MGVFDFLNPLGGQDNGQPQWQVEYNASQSALQNAIKRLPKSSPLRMYANSLLKVDQQTPFKEGPETQFTQLAKQFVDTLPQQLVQERLANAQQGDIMANQRASARWLAHQYAKTDTQEAYAQATMKPLLAQINPTYRALYSGDAVSRAAQPTLMSRALIKSFMAGPTVDAFASQLKRLSSLTGGLTSPGGTAGAFG